MFRSVVKRRLHNLQLEAKWCIFAQINLVKLRIKWTLFFHTIVSILMLLRIILLEVVPRYPPESLVRHRQVNHVPLESWELVWCSSISLSILVHLAVKRNARIRYLYTIILGNAVLGVGPIIAGMWLNREELWSYVSTRELPGMSLIYPSLHDELVTSNPHNPNLRPTAHEQVSHVTILQYYWMCMAIQVHIFQMIFLHQLCSIRLTTSKLK